MTSTVDSRPVFARVLARAAVLEERRGGAEHRRRLLAGLRGRVIELGAGSGVSFAYYPAAVTELVAVEPEAHLRAMAQEAAAEAPVPVRVVEGVADDLPAEDASMDAGVVTAVLCSVPDPAAALRELARVIRPGGELRFFEHVAARSPRLARRAARARRDDLAAGQRRLPRRATPRPPSAPAASRSRSASASRSAPTLIGDAGGAAHPRARAAGRSTARMAASAGLPFPR